MSIGSLMPVPGRKVYAEFQALPAAGLGNFPDHVALSALPWTFFDRVVRIPAGPEAKAVMMLAGQYDPPHSGGFAHPCPLTGIKSGRVENFRVFIPAPPFPAGKGIDRKMYKRIKLQPLPGVLAGRRQNSRGISDIFFNKFSHISSPQAPSAPVSLSLHTGSSGSILIFPATCTP